MKVRSWVTRHVFCALPAGHPEADRFHVELIYNQAPDLWMIRHAGYWLTADNRWTPDRTAAVGYDYATARTKAVQAAQTVQNNGSTAKDVFNRYQAARPALAGDIIAENATDIPDNVIAVETCQGDVYQRENYTDEDNFTYEWVNRLDYPGTRYHNDVAGAAGTEGLLVYAPLKVLEVRS